MRQRKLFIWGGLAFILCAGVVSAFQLAASAQQARDFGLDVSPSPLVATVKPGQPTDLTLRVRNSGATTENLKIEPRKFTVNERTGEVILDAKELPDAAPWISFDQPTFTAEPGVWKTLRVHVALPKESGFSYSLALVISRASDNTIVKSGQLVEGSVAVFTLINVDRPGAVRKLDVADFSSSQGIYEYLPAKFNIKFKNTGNTIVQPYGNVFIQRGSTDKHPIATLPVNNKKGYLLPGSPRTMQTEWNQGFPVFQTAAADDGSQKQELTWDWSKLTDFRIGLYTAKLVAVYNDGQRDVPIVREVTFWVIPWRSILLIAVVLSVLAYLRHKQIERKTRKAVKRALEEHEKEKEKQKENEDA